MNQKELIPHLFRTEFSKISAVLVKRFGIEHIQVAEDIASETFLRALETWSFKGVPENPVAWLYTVAKNKTRNYIQRDHIFREKILKLADTFSAEDEQREIDLSEKNITDSQLQMLFALCHPSLPAESQVGLSLRILCGFGIDEIANAFLTNAETISKRLFRAKEKLRAEKVKIEFPSTDEISNRLETVLITLYLLYNEGYYSESQDEVIREDLCTEAMRLTRLLIENPMTDLPGVNALYALMCFHASRFTARKNETGEIILFHDQDEARWDRELITQGAYHLNRASAGDSITKYHLEAGIAYWHTVKTDTKEKWEAILQLYNKLLQMEYSPIAALNRTFALYKANGKEEAMAEAEKLQLTGNRYYHTLLGKLYTGTDIIKARAHFQAALSLAKTQADRQMIQAKIDALTIL